MDSEDRITFFGLGRHVCDQHLDNEYLREWVRANATSTDCDFCDRKSDSPIAAALDELGELILDGVESQWDDAVEILPGGMQYDQSATTREVLHEHEVSSDEDLLALLVKMLPDRAWVRDGFWRLTDYERLVYGWRDFKDLVRHQSRFFFPLIAEDDDDPDSRSPLNLLGDIGDAAVSVGLVATWPEGTDVFRVRIHERDADVSHAWNVGAVPNSLADRAFANRMSPAGIPMLYAATDEQTAIEEAKSAEPNHAERLLTLAHFQAIRPLTILELHRRFDVPSEFNPNARDLVAPLAFLNGFVEDISVHVERDGTEHVDYVPTQVVTEYFRSVYSFGDGVKLDGISFPSSRSADGSNVVLFVSSQDVADPDNTREERPDNERFLGPTLPRSNPVLRLVRTPNTQNAGDA